MADRFKLNKIARTTENYGTGWKSPANAPKDEKYYVTTAIMYTNGNPHIGHAYEVALADYTARFNRMYGRDTFFLSGTDEHGQKIAETAERVGMTPQDMVNMYKERFEVLYQRLRVSENHFVRTTDAQHKDTARKLWQMCEKVKDDIYLGHYEGWYNVREEAYVTDADAEAWEFKDPSSGKPLELKKEASYFLRLSKYHDRLMKHIEENPDFIQPESYRNQIIARLTKDPLRDLSISRTTFEWGVRVPENCDQKHVMYVWFDALSNYISGVQGLDDPPTENTKYWPANHHIIGKDILWFHTVIWPIMLMSANVPLPKSVMAHGFIHDENGDKMSKSLGNTIDAHDILDKYPCDTVRWLEKRN